MSAPLTRRPETEADEPFLRALYAHTRTSELAALPWNDAVKAAFLRQQFDAQRLHYRRVFPRAGFDVLLDGALPAGRLSVDRTGEEWHLIEIALLPDLCGQGRGTALLRALLAEAGAAGRAVLLHVRTDNPARRLYARLGFAALGGDALTLQMAWRPPDPAQSLT